MAATRERQERNNAVTDPLVSGQKLSPGPGMLASEVGAHQSARIQKAMVEIVAERGYSAVKVRELVLLAGVSSRAFYENFASKEDCFLRTYELVARRATRRIVAAQAGERDWRERPLLLFDAFARELEEKPNTARFALVEAYAAGPVALEQARRAERTFEGMVGESFARAPSGIVVPPLVVEGMVAGIARVARGRLTAGKELELPGLAGEMMEWALCYPGESANSLAELDLGSVWRNTRLQPIVAPSGPGGEEMWPTTGDRALLLSSVAALAVADGYSNLTVTRIRSGAGVSRKVFDTYFDGVEDCFVAALEQRAGEAIAQAARAQTAGRSWSGGVYRAVAAFCDQIAGDPLLASVCLTDDFAVGSTGSRLRQRLIEAVAEQLGDSAPLELRAGALATEASAGAVWSLFHHHIVRERLQRRQVAATVSFMALAASIGAPAAVAAIQSEQVA